MKEFVADSVTDLRPVTPTNNDSRYLQFSFYASPIMNISEASSTIKVDGEAEKLSTITTSDGQTFRSVDLGNTYAKLNARSGGKYDMALFKTDHSLRHTNISIQDGTVGRLVPK